MRLFAVWFIFVSVFAFDGSECVFFILFTTLENGEEGVVRSEERRVGKECRL